MGMGNGKEISILVCVGRKGKEIMRFFGVQGNGKRKKMYFWCGKEREGNNCIMGNGKWERQNESSQCGKEIGRKY